MKTQILLTIEHDKEVPDLLDKVAGRAYTIDGVEDVSAKPLIELPVVEMEAVSDRCLRPIRPGEGEDEMLRIAGKPTEVTAWI